jgi:hypothetical protein
VAYENEGDQSFTDDVKVQENPHCGFPRFNIEDLETKFKMVIFTPSNWLVRG